MENKGYEGSVQLFEQVARVKESFNRLRNTGPHNVPEGFEEDTLETLRARRFEGWLRTALISSLVTLDRRRALSSWEM